jgi:hypothetical protein
LRSFNLSLAPGIAALLPPAPSSLKADPAGETAINLSWTPLPASAQGFRIEHSLDGISFGVSAILPFNTATFQVQNLKSGIRHHFRIRAVNNAGESAPSNVASTFTRTPFGQWRFTRFSAAEATNEFISGPSADPDEDRLMNFGEFAFDTDPKTPDRNGVITPFIDRTTQPAGVLAATYSRNRRAVEAAIRARVASSFDSPLAQSTNFITPSIISQTETRITETVRDTSPLPTAPRRGILVEAVNVGLRDVWETLPPLPVALEGAVGAVIGQMLYVVGGGNNATLAFNFSLNQWTNLPGVRPFPSAYHSIEVISNRLYLIGGLSGPAVGKTQIYDPATNGWSVGPALPYSIGICATAVLLDGLYVSAPDSENPLRNLLARFSLSDNRWTTNLPGMPQTRIHAAAGTDGAHLFLFGGRNPAAANNDGTDTVQVYDPISNSWVSSAGPGAWILPLPQARCGMGKALFRDGRFYVMGGETTFGLGATPQRTYNRVDIYYVALNQWSAGTPMLTARHGFASVLHDGRIYVAGGGLTEGSSGSAIFDVYFP